MNCGCPCDGYETLEKIAADMAEALQAWLGSSHDSWVFGDDGKFIRDARDAYTEWKRKFG